MTLRSARPRRGSCSRQRRAAGDRTSSSSSSATSTRAGRHDRVGTGFTTPGDEGAYNALTGDFGLTNLGTRQTCCYPDVFRSAIGDYRFDHTVDHVMMKPAVNQIQAYVTGADPNVTGPGGVVASDHGGLVSKLKLKPLDTRAARAERERRTGRDSRRSRGRGLATGRRRGRRSSATSRPCEPCEDAGRHRGHCDALLDRGHDPRLGRLDRGCSVAGPAAAGARRGSAPTTPSVPAGRACGRRRSWSERARGRLVGGGDLLRRRGLGAVLANAQSGMTITRAAGRRGRRDEGASCSLSRRPRRSGPVAGADTTR